MKSFGARAAGQRLERMRASAQWVEGTPASAAGFRNRGPIRPGLRDNAAPRPTLTEFLCGGNRRVPAGTLPVVDPLVSWRRPAGRELRATWLGHSTVLLELGSARLLTDPVWGVRASPSRLAGPRRFHPMPVSLRDLPPLDAVLISHDHYDHLCMATVRELARRQPGTAFITSLGVGAHLEAFGIASERIIELDWWESHVVSGTEVRLTATPSQHFSGRGLKDRNATLWSGFVIEDGRQRVFFSGDTGLTDQYTEIRRRWGGGTPFDLVMLEVGAWHPSWGDIHLGPGNALEALALLGGGAFLPVHWSTFSLALHAWDEPAETLLELAPQQGVQLVMPRPGEAVRPADSDGVRPWWRGVDTRSAGPPEVLSWPKAMPFPLD
ncbi:MAG: MBL fold metallo-hydrolase [Rubrivivax sp.]|nr:MBL fold metallo-hydrolase [Rubrivivax sp.]